MYEAIIQVCYVLAGIVVGCTNGSVHTDNPQLVEQVAPIVYLYDAPSLVLNYYRTRPNFVVYDYPVYRPQTVYRTRGHHHHRKHTTHHYGHKKHSVYHRSHKKATVHGPVRKKVTVHNPHPQPKKAKVKHKKRTKRKPVRHHPKRRSRLD